MARRALCGNESSLIPAKLAAPKRYVGDAVFVQIARVDGGVDDPFAGRNLRREDAPRQAGADPEQDIAPL